MVPVKHSSYSHISVQCMKHAVNRRSGATYSALGHLAQQLELGSSKTDDGRESKGEKLHGDGCGISCIRFRERVKASKQSMRMNGKRRAKDVDEGQRDQLWGCAGT